ncbi:hypothetical protein SAMN05444170_5722 [Bradyrhizobium erythrophlei]|jgi:hypothetical protein|uniref:Uncharacterized protein n=1 Tax=Bradyrhizobium erythrophlei TaxID=1437360 RepID=A0A1M7UM15_9BRAD|nr:hypothetical protein SAMN05444170_5722 [Bradyrhizobium erythrophlei]
MITLKLIALTLSAGMVLAAISPDLAYDFFLAVVCCCFV